MRTCPCQSSGMESGVGQRGGVLDRSEEEARKRGGRRESQRGDALGEEEWAASSTSTTVGI